MVHFIWFTDEKLFTVAPPINAQNDRLYVSTTTLKRNLDANRLLRTRPTFSRSLIVSVAVSKLGCKELFFVEPYVNVHGEYYGNVLLMEKPAIWECQATSSSSSRTAPQHIDVASDLGDVKRLLHLPAGQRPSTSSKEHHCVGPELWPANSPDLNPVDYRIWGLIQERVYQTAIRDIDELKECLIVVWAELKQSVIVKAILNSGDQS